MRNTKYYFVWIEGFSPKRGEKLKNFIDYDYTITTRMSDAMRVKPEHLHIVKHELSRLGIADWVLESPETFRAINYAPTGTVFIP